MPRRTKSKSRTGRRRVPKLGGRKLTGGETKFLPGSLFQLLELFCKLPYEVSIQVNSNNDGEIELFLTKGFEDTYYTDYKNELDTRCGIHIHTHPFSTPARTADMKYWTPSGTDIGQSINDILSKRSGFNSKTSYYAGFRPQIKYDYVFDGYNLWYYKPNQALINEYVALTEEGQIEVREQMRNACIHNNDNLGSDLVGLRTEYGFPKINIQQYLDEMKDLLGQKSLNYADNDVMGFDIGLVSDYKKEQVNIPDILECKYKEKRDVHILLPETGLLNIPDLDSLYQKCLRIMENRWNTRII
jgi:hypothetical protein